MAEKAVELAKEAGMKYFKMLMVVCFIAMAVVAGRPDVSMAVARQRGAAPATADRDRIQAYKKNATKKKKATKKKVAKKKKKATKKKKVAKKKKAAKKRR